MIQKVVLALSLLLGSQLAMAQMEPYQEGVHYFKIDQVPASTDSDTVEVTELFSYACSHCNTIDVIPIHIRISPALTTTFGHMKSRPDKNEVLNSMKTEMAMMNSMSRIATTIII